jgi:hypothetical protein
MKEAPVTQGFFHGQLIANQRGAMGSVIFWLPLGDWM